MKSRSPRFPFLPLEEAVSLLQKLAASTPDSREKPLTRPQLLEACGYASFHGAAVKTIGALRAYDLLQKKEDGHYLSPVAIAILDAKDPEERLESLQKAALSPLTFRNIWRQNRHSSRDEIQEFLLGREFTETGAKRASKIYKKNSRFAQLRQLELEPELPIRGTTKKKRGGVGPARKRAADARRQGAGPPQMGRDPNRFLSLPLSKGPASIPKGITEDEFKMLMQTLRLWKDQLVAPADKLAG